MTTLEDELEVWILSKQGWEEKFLSSNSGSKIFMLPNKHVAIYVPEDDGASIIVENQDDSTYEEFGSVRAVEKWMNV